MGAALALLSLFSTASAGLPDWSPAASGLEALKAPLLTMLVVALTIGFAFAWYGVVTNRKGKNDD